MSTSSSLFPDTGGLLAGLSSLLGRDGSTLTITALKRRPNGKWSTYPSELVTCSLADGNKLKLFCKYDSGVRGTTRDHHACYGHRGSVVYEAEVYGRLLRYSGLSRPAWFGSHRDHRTGNTWLVLEHLDTTQNVDFGPEGLCAAARWVGEFHRECELRKGSLGFLRSYNRSYYRGWVQRTLKFAAGNRKRFPWLPKLCGRADEFITKLLRSRLTAIHGEFCPANIVYREGTVFPVDWESAALAPGEIDLAALTDLCPLGLVRECERAYRDSRWPDGAPVDFARTLGAARLYWLFRWLGNTRAWTAHHGTLCWFELLRREAEKWSLI